LKTIQPRIENRIGAREIIKKSGKPAGIALKCHDLRRHAATHASRSGTPVEIVSKVGQK